MTAPRARLVRWLTLPGMVIGMAWTIDAWAQTPMGPTVSWEFLIAAVWTLGLALAHGYARGVDRRVVAVETRLTTVEGDVRNVDAALGLHRTLVVQNHYSKAEIEGMKAESARHTSEHRERVERALHEINHRLDYLSRPQHRRSDDDPPR